MVICFGDEEEFTCSKANENMPASTSSLTPDVAMFTDAVIK